MYLLPKDNELLQYLFDSNVFTNQDYAAWEKPDEGELMPVLVANKARYSQTAYLYAALKSDHEFVHVPNLELEWDFVRQHPIALLYRLLDEFAVLPVRREGSGGRSWFTFASFLPFSKSKIADAYQIRPANCVWVVQSPAAFDTLAKRFTAAVPRFTA